MTHAWDAYNEFLLHGRVDRIAKLLARYELFRHVIELPGDVVEGGVFKGAGLMYWAKLIQIFNPLSARRVVGFDTFDGYPETAGRSHDRDTGRRFERETGYVPIDPAALVASSAALGLDGRVELVKGDATRTIPGYVRANPGFRVAILNIDFDTYEATATALEHLYPRVVEGGVVVFDDYGVRGWGESDAVDDFFRGLGVKPRAIPWALSPTAFVRKRSGR